MSQVQISATSQPISVTASAGAVTAGVTSTTVSTSAGGGIGPQGVQGIQGPQGIPGDALAVASDVQLVGLTDGDVLGYSTTQSAWVNFDAIDGGNW